MLMGDAATYADLPPDAVKHARMILASTLASAASGTQFESARIVRNLAVEQGGAAQASVWFDTARLPLAQAVRVNAMWSDAAASDDSDLRNVAHTGTLVSAVGLGVADFRAGERTFQLLTQVAGRAGRGERVGEAIVQTLYPEHYSIQLACRQDYAAFFDREFAYRRGMRYPPTVALVNVVVRGRSFDEAMGTANDVVQRLKSSVASGGFAILGPAPAPLVRLRGEHRVQFFLKGARRADMRNALKAMLTEMPDVRRRMTIDIDPLNVM
jgi:hypothetical protein